MADIKIKYIDLAKKLGVGIASIKEYMEEKGKAAVSPNAKVDDSTAKEIIKHFKSNLSLEQIKKELEEKKVSRKKANEEKKATAAETTAEKPKKKETVTPKTVEKAPEKKETPEKEEKTSKEKKSPFSTIGHVDIDTTTKRKGVKVVASAGSEDLIKEKKKSSKDEKKVTVLGNINKTEEAPEPATQKAKKEEKSATSTPVSEPNTPSEDTPTEEAAIYRPSERQQIQVKVAGRIDLSKVTPTKKSSEKGNNKRRKRINPKAVDIKSEGAKVADNKGGQRGEGGRRNNQRNNNNASNNIGRKKKKANVQKAEISEEDVQKQVKETLARLQGKKNNFGKKAQARKDRRDAHRIAAEEAFEAGEREKKILKLTEFVTVSDLANMMDVPVNEVISTCMAIDMMVSINMRLDGDTIKMVAEEFGFETDFVSSDVVDAIKENDEEDAAEDLVSRAPIVTVMGHVDHGKTSLLDNIRESNVIAGEAGGITQHIGSYSVTLESGRQITFLDTPGHEAFTAMRARGAKATDIAIIIIACNDQVMPQTVEAINHAAAAGVPMIFAFNKIDVAGANPDKIREQLASMNYLVEDWGGKYQCQEISAKKGIAIKELLEKVLLEADLLDLQANPKRRASGLILESSLDKGRGYVSNLLVQNGTLRVGDIILAGKYYGHVKAMTNERNQPLKEAGPSTPATILGFNGAPSAGDTFNILETEQEARDIANKRTQLEREQGLRTQKMLTLDDIGHRIAIGNFQELNLIIKGDVDGSVEALSDSLIRLSTEEIVVRTIHKGVGQISESDVVLAEASNAVIIGFQVRPNAVARKKAEQTGVEIRTYSIIYDAIEEVRSAMEGMLSPEIKEQVTALLEIQQTFTIGKVGTIAGCMVKEGKIHRTDKVRVIRDGIVVFTGDLESLKRFKDDVKEVAVGLDCGLNVKGFNDLKEGDLIEAFEEIEVKKKLK